MWEKSKVALPVVAPTTARPSRSRRGAMARERRRGGTTDQEVRKCVSAAVSRLHALGGFDNPFGGRVASLCGLLCRASFVAWGRGERERDE